MKLFNTMCQYLLLLMGLVLVLLPAAWFPGFYDVRFMGVWMCVGAATIRFLPMLIPPSKAQDKNKIIEPFRFALAVAILGDALGSLGFYELYKYGIGYDKILHFGVPLIMVLVLSLIFREGYQLSALKSTMAAIVVVAVCAIDWELFESVCDDIFRTHLTGVYHTDIFNDTKLDLMYDLLGAMLGGVILIFRKKMYASSAARLEQTA